LSHPRELQPEHVSRRISAIAVATYADLYPVLAPGDLLTGTRDPRFAAAWQQASADTFQRIV
jgi:hypothetical protein